MQKYQRLRDSADFARLRFEGKVYRHPLLMVSFAPNHLSYNRYGFITSKRLGNAVQRNRTRRLLRESIRPLDETLKSGYDVVVVAREQIVGESYQTVYQGLVNTLRRASLLTQEA